MIFYSEQVGHIFAPDQFEGEDEPHETCGAATVEEESVMVMLKLDGRRTTYKSPMVNTADIPNLRFRGSCKFQIVYIGNNRVAKSVTVLLTAEIINVAPTLMHRPGSHGAQIFRRGTHWKARVRAKPMLKTMLIAIRIQAR